MNEMSLEDLDLTPDKAVLLKQAELCCSLKKPMSYVEVNKMLWRAFELGKEYRDKGGTE